MTKNKLKVALLCGGPSLERGISLNSARSVCDHLNDEQIEVLPVYFDHNRKPYQISRGQLYCNTPSDFDFKLHSNAKPLTEKGFARFLKSVDLAFPVMHGQFGEDGQIQRILEKHGCPYIGAPEQACKKAFDKYEANELIKKHNFYTLPSTVLKIHRSDHKELLTKFFSDHNIKRAAVKPATGGSSIGVFSVSSAEEALEKAQELFSKRMDTRVVVEPFCEGAEFTVVLLENRFDMPVAILPSEIEIDYRDHQIFDYRKKYLATNHVKYHCPPRFDNEVVERIQIQAQQLFKLLGMRDFARFDGWLMEDGNIWFSDFNPISGMEQNSFLFQQTAQIGMSHRDVLRFIVKNACRRYNITFPESARNPSVGSSTRRLPLERGDARLQGTPINVLFGGSTAERQVSLMSGTNVWLKLKRSDHYNPKPYLLDADHNVWKLPYSMTLNHTVEEITEMCEKAAESEARLKRLKTRVIDKLSPLPGEISEEVFLPEKMSLDQFIKSSNFIFSGLHGGIGEDGTLQKMCEEIGVPFNGSGSKSSQLCMNKYQTAQALKQLEGQGIYTCEKQLEPLQTFDSFLDRDYQQYWKQLTKNLVSKSIIVKPIGDGCSAGIARLFSAKDLATYIYHAQKQSPLIPYGQLTDQHGLIEMPPKKMEQVMFERFVITDKVQVVQDKLKWQTKGNWIEVTIGLLEQDGEIKAMNPSITVASGNVLTLEEKFQGGTGVNITPPPSPHVKPSAVKQAKERMELVAKALGISGYARIDAFMHVKTGELIIIEANSTPGLTPSTVIYHQALEEEPKMYPTQFLKRIVENGMTAKKTKVIIGDVKVKSLK